MRRSENSILDGNYFRGISGPVPVVPLGEKLLDPEFTKPSNGNDVLLDHAITLVPGSTSSPEFLLACDYLLTEPIKPIRPADMSAMLIQNEAADRMPYDSRIVSKGEENASMRKSFGFIG